MRRLLVVGWIVFTGGGCGGGGSGEPTFQCDGVPGCYQDALAALRDCVPTAQLTLVPVTPMSGVVDGLTCVGGDLEVAFSAFSESPSGTVPVPSGVTLTLAGSRCGALGSGTGVRTDADGNSRSFELSSLAMTGIDEVDLERYPDGELGVNCSPPTGDTVFAPAGALAGCPDAVLFHEVVRNADITQIGVDLVDAAGGRTSLFSCQ